MIANETQREIRKLEEDRIYRDPSNLFKLTAQHYEDAERNGIGKYTVRARVNKYGWTVQEAITIPPMKMQNKPDGFDEHLELAKSNGIQNRTFRERVKLGWSLSEAATKPHVPHTTRTRKDGEWIDKALQNGISYSTYSSRIRMGWSPSAL